MSTQTPGEGESLHRVDMFDRTPVMKARDLVKRYGRVAAIDGTDLDLYPGEILAVVGATGAGKSSLVKALSGALVPDSGEIWLDGEPVSFRTTTDARAAGVEAVYQAPGGSLFRARTEHKNGPLNTVLEMLDRGPERPAGASPFSGKVVILDEPTAALGARESNRVLELVRQVRDRGLPVILISHNLPHVFEVADRIHIQRMGRRVAVVTPSSHTIAETVEIMTGTAPPPVA